ncbi:DUF418 domain-containing protein [Bacillus suaedae]|uniref:DUF418 domain-containing protein n=1 Tax=Halalkalibacter suaedae TaxID=2822140 RepID=A0A941AQQ0_9BACI|nr:DUF418 domain-containing protein [Bacillus suaedae]MBP3953022.1 DUF418 domain-containing protein [Bacillus suaedae]
MNNRIAVVDALRGLSLFGILAANMLIFQYGIYGKDEMEQYSVSNLDQIIHIVLKVLVESSFMPIFAFLFGYGIIKMKESLENKGLPVKRYLARRFLLLLIFGFAHSILLWEGDILTAYGMTGFFLLLFFNRKIKTLYIWGVITTILIGALSYGTGDFMVTSEDKSIMTNYVTTTIDVYRNGSFLEILTHRMNEDPMLEIMPKGALLFILVIAPIMILPMFLFGMISAKQQWFNKLRESTFQLRWKKLTIIFVASGIFLKLMPYIFPDLGLSGTGYGLGGSVLAIGYILLFSLLLNHKENILVKGFTAVGRLSLSNYLFQTMICILIFYGFGLGLFGKLGVLAGVGLTILIYSIQLIGSLLYLKVFKTGPFEKVLRMWTYLKWNGGRDSLSKSRSMDGEKVG